MNVHPRTRGSKSPWRGGTLVWTLLAIFAAFAAAGLATAQDSQESRQQTPATIRSETHAILISVSARDPTGRAIENLQKQDFTVTDNGQPRDFVIFPNDSGPEVAHRRLTTSEGYFSNRLSVAPSGRMTAILLDAINTGLTDQIFARQQAIKAIEKTVPDESVAVYAMNPGITVLQDYTTDRNALLAAVQAFGPRQSLWTAPVKTASPGAYSAENQSIGATSSRGLAGNHAMKNISQFYLDQRVLATVAALKAIATHMSGASHRNSIIWITAGFPANLDSNQQLLEAIRAINDANVAIYPVDARGLPVTGIDSNIQIMDGIAEYTGGVAYTMRNDVGQAIDEAIAAPEHTYLLGFYAGNADMDGKFHRLHVSVDKPGVSLNYRSGYTASADPNTSREGAEPLESELLSPVDSSAIGIDGKVTELNAPAGKQLRIKLVLDRANLPYAPNSKVLLSQMFVELDARGRVIAKVASDVSFEMPSADRKAAYSQTIREQEGAKELRVVLQDKMTKQTGSLRIPLTGTPAQ